VPRGEASKGRPALDELFAGRLSKGGAAVSGVEGTSGAATCWRFRDLRWVAALQGTQRFGVARRASQFSQQGVKDSSLTLGGTNVRHLRVLNIRPVASSSRFQTRIGVGERQEVFGLETGWGKSRAAKNGRRLGGLSSPRGRPQPLGC
jgi:hypothetical protein